MNLELFQKIVTNFIDEKPIFIEKRDDCLMSNYKNCSVGWHKKVGFVIIYDDGRVVPYLKLNQQYYKF